MQKLFEVKLMYNWTIGENIKKYRKLNGLSQEVLGELIGKSARTIQRYEKGEINIPSNVLEDLSKIFRIDIIYFLEQEAENKLSIAIEQLEDLGFTVHQDEHDEIYDKIALNSPDGYTIKTIDKNTLIDAFDHKTNSLKLRKIFSNSEYDKYILGITENSKFIDYLEKKGYNIHITETPNGGDGYVKILIGKNKYKIDYDKIEDLEKKLLKYFENMILPDYECDDDEWELFD